MPRAARSSPRGTRRTGLRKASPPGVERADDTRNRGTADVRCAARAPRARDSPGARSRRLGGVRSIHRRNLRVPGRRAWRAIRRASVSSSGGSTRIASPTFTFLFDVRSAYRAHGSIRGARRSRPRQVRTGGETPFHAGARRVPRARKASPARFRVIDSTRPVEVVRAELRTTSGPSGAGMTSERESEPVRLPWLPLLAVATRGCARGIGAPRDLAARFADLRSAGDRQACACAQFSPRRCSAKPTHGGLACGECAGCRYAVAGQHRISCVSNCWSSIPKKTRSDVELHRRVRCHERSSRVTARASRSSPRRNG